MKGSNLARCYPARRCSILRPVPTTSAAVLQCLRSRAASPRTDSFDYDVNSGQGALDLALHAVDFRLQEFLHFLDSDTNA